MRLIAPQWRDLARGFRRARTLEGERRLEVLDALLAWADRLDDGRAAAFVGTSSAAAVAERLHEEAVAGADRHQEF